MSAAIPRHPGSFQPGTISQRKDEMGSGHSKPVREGIDSSSSPASEVLQPPAAATVADYAGGPRNVGAAVAGTLGMNTYASTGGSTGGGGIGGSSRDGDGSEPEAISVALGGGGGGRAVEGGMGMGMGAGQAMTAVGSPTGKARCAARYCTQGSDNGLRSALQASCNGRWRVLRPVLQKRGGTATRPQAMMPHARMHTKYCVPWPRAMPVHPRACVHAHVLVPVCACACPRACVSLATPRQVHPRGAAARRRGRRLPCGGGGRAA